MKVGLFGGTFDPVHFGHLLLAERCCEECSLDEVWFVPANIPPHKQGQNIAHHNDRLRMLKLAISGCEKFQISDIELKRGGISYTIDTIEQVRLEYPDIEFYLLIAAELLLEFPTWKRHEELHTLVKLVAVVSGGNFSSLKTRLSSYSNRITDEAYFVNIPEIQLSSSEIRQRVQNGMSIKFMTPSSVEEYIMRKGLYRT